MSKFLLLLGPSGVGKSSIIEELIRLDGRFVYISPFITRPLRKGEKNKISVSGNKIDEMWERGELLVINELYGVRYATPRQPIEQALKEGNFPVLDWPISEVGVMTGAFPGQLYVVYISPPSVEVLQQRLARDNRDTDGHRLRSARKELEALESFRHSGIYNFEIVSEENRVHEVAQMIYTNYLQQFFPQQP
jgi:guanylate kinase